MSAPAARPLPLLGDLALSAVQRIDHSLDGGFHDVPVLGLAGHAQQRSGRPSHRVAIQGVLAGPTAVDDLAALQALAGSGEETMFAADIVTALDLAQVVVTHLAVAESAGTPGVIAYSLELAESPPLPPPAELSGFGGLDDFGLGDLGFDTDILGDLADLAGDIAGAVDGALAALDALDALAGLAALDFAGLLEPVGQVSSVVQELGGQLGDAVGGLSDLLGA